MSTNASFEGVLDALQPEQQGSGEVRYALAVGGNRLPLAMLIGRQVAITGLGGILCVSCGAASATSHGGGHCRRCFLSLPACDHCFRSPERCHHHLGSCRDPAWGTRVCMADHVVYLAETSGVKVGITRPGRVALRWAEQGALQARPWLQVRTRRIAGVLEAVLRSSLSDRTNWRQMLRANRATKDLEQLAVELTQRHGTELERVRTEFGVDAWRAVDGATTWHAHYPVPIGGAPALRAFKLQAVGNVVQGRILGAKARYLLLDTGVLNTASHAGTLVRLQLDVAPDLRGQADLFT